MVKKSRNKNGEFIFSDYPEFRPNLSPKEIFDFGSFGGTYWRPIYSNITKKWYENVHQKYPKSWFKDDNSNNNTLDYKEYDKSLNKYNVKVGTTLRFWESKGWITKYHPYGWIQWYCDFFRGERCPDDERQIKRWMGICGPNGRFRKWLVSQIKQKNGKWSDEKISPKIRQTLQHWGYRLTKNDMKK